MSTDATPVDPAATPSAVPFDPATTIASIEGHAKSLVAKVAAAQAKYQAQADAASVGVWTPEHVAALQTLDATFTELDASFNP